MVEFVLLHVSALGAGCHPQRLPPAQTQHRIKFIAMLVGGMWRIQFPVYCQCHVAHVWVPKFNFGVNLVHITHVEAPELV